MLNAVSTGGVSDFIKRHSTIIRSCLDYSKIRELDQYVEAKHHHNVDVDRRKFDVGDSHSFYILDEVRSFALAGSDNDSYRDPGQIDACLGERGAAVSQILRLEGGWDLENGAHSKDGPVAKGASGSDRGPDLDNTSFIIMF